VRAFARFFCRPNLLFKERTIDPAVIDGGRSTRRTR
jgi:hypothetical protein